MTKPIFLFTLFAALLAPTAVHADAFRPPAVPLVVNDPYLSIWSEADHLNDAATRHWTRRPMPLVSLIRIDGKAYRLMGDDPASVPAFPQTSVKVTPTRSIYQFENPSVHVTLTFMTAALPGDLDALTRPVSYLTWRLRSADGAKHTVSIYDSVGSEIAVNTPDQAVTWQRETPGPLTALQVGAAVQNTFAPKGDDVRIDWGYGYLVAPAKQSASAIGGNSEMLESFVSSGTLPAQDDTRMPRAVSDDEPVLAVTLPFGAVGASPVERHVLVAYNESYNIELRGHALRPYWRRGGITPAQMLEAAERDYPSLVTRCSAFDQAFTADLTKAGGAKYAQICALAYRQCLAGTGISVDAHGQPLMFPKENSSNGDIATVDIDFPMDPLWILVSPALAKASLVPDLDYGSDPRWKFPNAPHDLGVYPQASATFEAGEAMPVEECADLLILCDAVSQDDGSAKFVAPWWPALTRWAEYLKENGPDPDNQLFTNDFMGPFPHNANLAAKAIVGLAAYADLCRLRGERANAAQYKAFAKADARQWAVRADNGSGGTLLAFDQPGTWSQKYNLVWDHLLGLDVFPPSVRQKEVAYYLSKRETYGVPLFYAPPRFPRTHVISSIWTTMSATMANNNADFEAIFDPMYDYYNATTVRDPLTEPYDGTLSSSGNHARPAIGDLFIRMLSSRAIWKKWADAGQTTTGNWDTNLPDR